MKQIFKIILLVVMVLPLWLTIVAFGDQPLALIERLNQELDNVQDRRVQIISLDPKSTLETVEPTDSISIDLTNARPQGLSELSVKVSDQAGRVKRSSKIRAQLMIEVEVPVATRRLESGDLLSDNVRWEWRDASRVSGDRLTKMDLSNRRVKVAIPSGDIVTVSRTELPQLVSRGDRVTIHVVGDGIKVSGMGIAEQSGSRGQMIRVTNLDSKKEVVGVIADKRVVEVRL